MIQVCVPRQDKSLRDLAKDIPGKKCHSSSIENDNPRPDICENCSQPRMKTLNRPICWICARMLASVATEIEVTVEED